MKNLLITCADARLNTNTYHIKTDAEKVFNVSGMYEIKLPGPDASCWQDAVLRAIGVFSDMDDITVIVVGHEDCAGHKCTPEQHEIDIQALSDAITAKYPDAKVYRGICRKDSNESWHIEKI